MLEADSGDLRVEGEIAASGRFTDATVEERGKARSG